MTLSWAHKRSPSRDRTTMGNNDSSSHSPLRSHVNLFLFLPSLIHLYPLISTSLPLPPSPSHVSFFVCLPLSVSLSLSLCLCLSVSVSVCLPHQSGRCPPRGSEPGGRSLVPAPVCVHARAHAGERACVRASSCVRSGGRVHKVVVV